MPLALLLHDAFGSWQRDVAKLSGWNRLVDLEDALLARARGMFLVRWFGEGVPTFAGDARVAIANLDQLATRYHELRRQAMGGSDLNLTEPLAGIAGTMVGAMLSPTSSMVLMVAIAEEMPNWVTTLAAALNWITFGALGALVFAVGVPVAAIGLPLAAVAAREPLGAVHQFLGTVAGLFVAAGRFIKQLIGPREEVRNPLLAQILLVLDDLATLVPFVFALAAFVILFGGPKLASLALQLDILIPMARNVFEIVGTILLDFFERLTDLHAGEHSPWAMLQGILATIRQWMSMVIDQFVGLYKIAAPAFESVPVVPAAAGKTELRAWQHIKNVLGDAFDRVLPFVKQMTTESWLVKRIKEIAARLSKIIDILDTLDVHTPAKKDGWVKTKLKAAFTAVFPFPATPSIADFPSAGEIFNRQSWLADQRWVQPDVVAAFAKPDGGTLFTLGVEGEKVLAKLQRAPVDPFAAERKALLDGRKPKDVLAKAQAEESALRTMLFAVIDTLLPAKVAAEVPKLQGLLWELDTQLYGKNAQFPVRDLPGRDRLSVRVDRVRVRAPGMRHGVVKAWAADLKIALANQVFATDRAVPA